MYEYEYVHHIIVTTPPLLPLLFFEKCRMVYYNNEHI